MHACLFAILVALKPPSVLCKKSTRFPQGIVRLCTQAAKVVWTLALGFYLRCIITVKQEPNCVLKRFAQLGNKMLVKLWP